jgi:hypothetical protein
MTEAHKRGSGEALREVVRSLLGLRTYGIVSRLVV